MTAARRRSRFPTVAEVDLFTASLEASGPVPADDSTREPAASAGRPARRTASPKPLPPLSPHNGVDGRTLTKLRRGLIRPGRTLDLHGYRVAAARDAVENFVLDARAQGHRCVRIITGRKLGEAGPTGALRAQLPHMVRSPDLRAVVLACEPAPRRDGGDGAFYLLLRNNRPK